MIRYFTLAVTTLVALGIGALASKKPVADLCDRVRGAIHDLDRSRQLVVVTAVDWRAVSGEVRLFERTDSSWRPVAPPQKVVLGRAGLAWGIGLHGTGETAGGIKSEGDGKAPAGVFPLIEAFGFGSAEDTKLGSRFRYRQLTDRDEGIDDPQSRHYNRIVDAGAVGGRDWKTSEPMRRIEPYRWGVVVGHNWDQVPGAGSCIFLHVWEAAGVPTSGCTAMAEDQMLRLLRWLDRTKKPVLVQLPAEEYRRLRVSWTLPELQP